MTQQQKQRSPRAAGLLAILTLLLLTQAAHVTTRDDCSRREESSGQTAERRRDAGAIRYPAAKNAASDSSHAIAAKSLEQRAVNPKTPPQGTESLRARTRPNAGPERPQTNPQERESLRSDTVVLRGRLVMSREVRTFTPDSDTTEYWVRDFTGSLEGEYDRLTGGSKTGQPLRATLKLRQAGPTDEGFAAEYPGVYEVLGIVRLERDR